MNNLMNVLYEIELMSATSNSFASIIIGVAIMELRKRTNREAA